MKHLYLIFIITLCLLVAAPAAQAQRKHTLDKDQMEMLFNAKMKMMQEKLNLTDEQTRQLIPVYKNYLTDIDNVFKSRTYNKRYKPSDANEACKVMTERLDVNEQVIKVQKKYIVEFAKILNADQVMKIYRVENQIQHEIWKEKKRRSRN